MNIDMFFKFPGILILVGIALLLGAVIMGIIANKRQEVEEDNALDDENISVVLDKKNIAKKEETVSVEEIVKEEKKSFFKRKKKEEKANEPVIETTEAIEQPKENKHGILEEEFGKEESTPEIDEKIEKIKDKYDIDEEPVNMFAELRKEEPKEPVIEESVLAEEIKTDPEPILEEIVKTQEIKIDEIKEQDEEAKEIEVTDETDFDTFSSAINDALGVEEEKIERAIEEVEVKEKPKSKTAYGGVNPSDTIDLSFLKASKKSIYKEKDI